MGCSAAISSDCCDWAFSAKGEGRGLLAKQARQIRRTAERKTKAFSAKGEGRGLLAKQARQIRRTAERKTKAYTAN
jgi:hypothetical protein